MRLIKEKTSIDFLGKKRRSIALGISAVLILISIGSLALRGLDFGIDFTGGVLLEVGYSDAANLEGIRTRLSDAGFADYRVTRFGADTDVQVRLPPQIGVEPDAIRESLREILAADDPNVDLRRVPLLTDVRVEKEPPRRRAHSARQPVGIVSLDVPGRHGDRGVEGHTLVSRSRKDDAHLRDLDNTRRAGHERRRHRESANVGSTGGTDFVETAHGKERRDKRERYQQPAGQLRAHADD